MIWTASRVSALAFTVIEVLLVVRFTLKLFGANAEQAMASAIYAITEPLVAPFRGIFAQPEGTQLVEIASLLSIVFFVLVVAVVRAFTGKRAETSVRWKARRKHHAIASVSRRPRHRMRPSPA